MGTVEKLKRKHGCLCNACVAAQMVTSSIQSSAAEASRPQTDKRLWTHASYDQTDRSIQSNLFNTDTKGKDPSVRFTEVSVYGGRECMIFKPFLGPNELSVL